MCTVINNGQGEPPFKLNYLFGNFILTQFVKKVKRYLLNNILDVVNKIVNHKRNERVNNVPAVMYNM